jgi:hypothetical protein
MDAPEQDTTLTITLRVEPGCLGPDGERHVSRFCRFARDKLGMQPYRFLSWVIAPRYHRQQPEIQYTINNKTLSREQALRYLKAFETDVDDVESTLYDQVLTTIQQYMQDQKKENTP